ncbi:DNA-directed RNA polymerase sigma-70 factor [Microtetraspora sp. NBRC 13810]|uniref:RNA polymerase sigma factor n=1 Tax=Microtetraspora sp. NBRC 13810 TaxID=3030990 RepID=UPI0024A27216|nr:RNA polymerase sigma factor [Microtetraspora sp. NBRC 13810]GLW12538.1 DNA-directed RNA polymerase sigma-70 factor [Microtetraspora sp. NBRC 13810]
MRQESRAAPPPLPADWETPPADGGALPADGEAADDAAVIEQSRHEPERFAALFVRHAPALKRYVIRRLGQDPAEDIVAETFAVAFQHRESYDLTRGDARPWLYGIATNLVRRHRRREIGLYRALSRTGADPVIEPFTDHVDQRVATDGARRRLAAALAKLSRGHRDALLLVTWAELTYEQAAQALGVPVGTVRSRVNRARSRLRRVLGDIDPTDAEERTK